MYESLLDAPMRLISGVVMLGLLFAAAPSGVHQRIRYPLLPLDEGVSDRSFNAFCEQFRSEVRNRNLNAVLASVEPRLKPEMQTVLLGGLPGAPGWEAMSRALALGGSFTTTRGAERGRREFCAPYTYSAYPDVIPNSLVGELDPWVIIGAHVPVRARPRSDSPALIYLDHELVSVNGLESPGIPPPLWFGVVVERHEGWVSADSIRNPEDYHVCFADSGSNWVLSTFRKGPSPRF
jgi:hypothetical protein